MRNRQWAFLVRSQAELAKAGQLLDKHNDRTDVGDALVPVQVVKYRGYYFVVLQNKLSPYATSAFMDTYIQTYEPEMMLFWPLQQPEDWSAVPKDCIWNGEACNPVLSLLPLETPPTPHPFQREPPNARVFGFELDDFSKPPEGALGPIFTVREEYSKAPCHACGKLTGNRCGKCKSAFACDKTCQKADWPFHRVNCKKIVANDEVKNFWLKLAEETNNKSKK